MAEIQNTSININFDLPISVNQVWFFGGLIVFGIFLVAILFIRDKWAAKENRSWRLHEKPLINAVSWAGWILSPLWAILIVLTIYGLFTLWFSIPVSGEGGETTVRLHYLALAGMTTVLAGLIGAPLAILRVHTVERQTKAQEEGLITDRINKAVEGLGAEKTEQSIGRPVTIYTGIPQEKTHWVNAGDDFSTPERSVHLQVLKSEHDVDPESGRSIVIDVYSVKTWPAKRTEIEWQDDTLTLDGTDFMAEEGAWQVFSRTVPNIEVRIGAIYALERIAKHNLDEHIQIMEILCAYIRENAPAASLVSTKIFTNQPILRGDIQTALSILGRRSETGKAIERSIRFQLDLRRIDITGGDLKNGDYDAVLFHRSRLEACNFTNSSLVGTEFAHATLNHSYFSGAKLVGTNFSFANYEFGNRVNSLRWGLMRGGTMRLAGANFAALSLTDRTAPNVFGSKDTIIASPKIDFDRLDELHGEFEDAIQQGDSSRIDSVTAALNAELFVHWSFYISDDLATGEYEEKFARSKGLTGWPHFWSAK